MAYCVQRSLVQMQGSEINAISYLYREASWSGKEEQIQVKLNKTKSDW